MTDWRLRWHIAAVLASVLVVNAVFATILVALAAPWLGPALIGGLASVGVPAAVVAGWWVFVAVPVVAGLTWLQLRFARRRSLAAVDAEPVTAETHPDLHERVRRLATLADCPPPAVAVADAGTPNSFAVAGPSGGTIVVSAGLLETLSGDELDAVLAHELAHLRNRDATVMTLASVLPTLVGDRWGIADALGGPAVAKALLGVGLVVAFVSGVVVTGQSPFDPDYVVRFLGALAATALLGGVALGVLATVGLVLARRLSRYREFVADRASARLTGEPAALAGALDAVDDAAEARPERDVRVLSPTQQHLCLLPHGFAGRTDPVDVVDGQLLVNTRSHPPVAERVDRLQSLQRDLDG